LLIEFRVTNEFADAYQPGAMTETANFGPKFFAEV
jgi:hypothetical protein